MTLEIKTRIAAINSGKVPEGYKKTKVGIVPVEWEVIKAKEVFSNISNKKHNGDLEVLSSTQDKGIIPRSMLDIDIKYDKESTSNYKKVEKGNFVISLRSFQGGIEYSEYEGLISPAYTVLGSKVEICDDYYKSYLKSPDYIQRLNTAVYGIRDGKNISYDDFSLIYIPFPPLLEQQMIAEILSTQDKLIELQEKKIEQLKKLKKAYLQKMFPKKGSSYPEIRFKGFTDPWEQRKCEAILKAKKGAMKIGPFGSALKKEFYTETGVKVYAQDNIFQEDFSIGEYYISEERYQTLKGCKLEVGDLVISMMGTIGACAIFPEDAEPGIMNSHLLRLQLKEDIYPEYIHQLLRDSQNIRNQIDKLSVGSIMSGLSSSVVQKLVFPIPSLDEQKKIAEFLIEFDETITLHQRKLEQEKQKKKALMQLLLTGKVRCV